MVHLSRPDCGTGASHFRHNDRALPNELFDLNSIAEAICRRRAQAGTGIAIGCRPDRGALVFSRFGRLFVVQPHNHMKLPCTLLLTACALAGPLAAQETKQMTVDQVVAKNIEARGGAEALHALQSLKMTGKLIVNQGQMQFGYSETRQKPNAVRTEYSLQGMTAVNAFDGKEGWKISPFQGRKDPEKLSVDDAKALVEDSEVDGPLIDWKEKGSTLEYLGTEEVDGTLAHKLKVTRQNGDVSYVFLDPEHFLEIRILTQRTEHGAKIEVETDLSDYEKVNGVFVPFSIETGRKGDPDKAKLIFDKVEGNVPVEESTFSFPTPAK